MLWAISGAGFAGPKPTDHPFPPPGLPCIEVQASVVRAGFAEPQRVAGMVHCSAGVSHWRRHASAWRPPAMHRPNAAQARAAAVGMLLASTC